MTSIQSSSDQPCTGKAVQVALFGDLQIKAPDGTEVAISNRRARAIVGMLCLSPDAVLDREVLSRLLWPGRFRAQARASLRQCLYDLNRQLQAVGGDILELGPDRIGLRRDRIETDFVRLETAMEDADLETVAELLHRVGSQPLLDNMDFGPAFADWLDSRRKTHEARLQVRLQGLLGDGAPADAAGCPKRHERLAVVRRAWQRFGAPDVTRDGVRLAVVAPRSAEVSAQEAFMAGAFAEELSARLSDIPGLRLAGAASIAALEGQYTTWPELAFGLGVTHLVEAAVRLVDDRVALTIRLLDGTDGSILWSDVFDTTMTDAIHSRQIIGSNSLAAMCAALNLQVPTAPVRRMTVNRDAYTLYLQGRSLVQRSMAPGAVEKAVELLERALDIDPSFAECWTALADAHIHTAVYTPSKERVELSGKASECARRAIALDPEQGHAHALLGIHQWTCGTPADAIDSAFEAFRLKPNDADVAARLGSFLLYVGLSRQALPYIEAAVDLDPIYGRNYALLCAARFNLGDIDGALKAGQRMVDLGMPGMWLAVVQAAAGDREAAFESYFRSRLLMGSVMLWPPGTKPMSDQARDAYWTLAAKGVVSGDPQDRTAYCRMLDQLHAMMADPYDPSIALPAIWMGHAELAMKIYRERLHPANMFGLMSLWADVDPIRQTLKHTDFMAFAEDMGLVDAWQRHGWPDHALLSARSRIDAGQRKSVTKAD